MKMNFERWLENRGYNNYKGYSEDFKAFLKEAYNASMEKTRISDEESMRLAIFDID